MPVAVIGAVAAYAATAVAVAEGIVIAGTIGAALVGAAASFAAQALATAAFSDSSSGDSNQAGPGFEAEMQGNLVTVRQAISPWQWIYGRTRVGGTITYIESSNDDSFLHLVITLAGHPVEDIESMFLDDEVVPFDTPGPGAANVLGRFAGYIYIEKAYGYETTQPFPNLVTESAGLWTDAHRQSGRAAVHVRLINNPDLFPHGIPNLTFVVKGRKVYDPRTGLIAWSATPSLCIADLLCSQVWLGADYDSEIDEAQLIAAANIEEEAVALAAGGTEQRYTMNGAFGVNMDTRSALARMLTANAGKVHYIGGVYRILPAAYVAPTLTFDEGDLRGVPHITPRLSAADLANGVKGIYLEPAAGWQPTDFPPVTNATYLAEDQGERSWRELDLPFTTSAATAQRIAKIELERMRQQISIEWPGKFTCFRAQPGDTVRITFAMMGWSSKVFEVVGGGLAVEDGGEGGVRLGSDLQLRETASSVFDWNSGEETVVDPAPDTNLPDPFSMIAPGAPSVSEEAYETTGSAGVKFKATVSWTGAGANADHYRLEYKAHGDSVWTVLPLTSDTSAVLFDLGPGTYDFRVKAISFLGVSSEYSPIATVEILGPIAPPADVAGFSVVATNGFAYASWDLHSDLDVKLGGHIEIAHSPLTTGAGWNNAILLKQFDGNAVAGVLALVTGTYMAKAIDATGHYSENAVGFTLTEGMITGFTTVGTLTEAPTFTGTKMNLAVVSSKLQLASGTVFDSVSGNFDAAAGNFDAFGGQATTGTYTFGPLDLSTVATRRFEADIAAEAFDNGDFFDEGQGSFDDSDGLFEGDAVAINDANAELFARITNDNPVGSPTPSWGPWVQFHVADFNCRAAEFRLDLSVDTPQHNIQISTLTVHAKEFA